MIIRQKPIKKSNKREYIIIETPGPGDFLWRATEKDKAIKLLFGEGKRRHFFRAAALDLSRGKVVNALFSVLNPLQAPVKSISVQHLLEVSNFGNAFFPPFFNTFYCSEPL